MTRGGQDKSSSPSQRSTQTLDPVINVVIVLNCIKNTRKKIFFVLFCIQISASRDNIYEKVNTRLVSREKVLSNRGKWSKI